MTVLGNVLRARNSLENPEIPLSSPALVDWLDGSKGSAGVRVTETTALGLPAVWRAVSVSSGVLASLPIHAYRKNDETRQPLTSGNAADVLARPHPDMTPFEFFETIYMHLLLWGNAYVRALTDQLGVLRELWIVHPSRVRAGRTSDDLGEKVYCIDGRRDTPYTDWNPNPSKRQPNGSIIHIPGLGYDGICGVAVVRALREGVSLGMAAQEFGAQFFGNGTLATGILQTEQRLEPGDADKLMARWKAKQSGLKKAHGVIILDHGAKFEQLSIPPEDAQFLQTRQFQVTEIGRMFGVPPFIMFDTEKSTSWGTGLEQQALGWVKFDLRRWYMRVEQRLTQALGTETQYVRYSVEGLLRGDTAARKEWYRSMWEIGAFSTDEIRALEDLGPVDGGDVRYRPLNMGELGQFESDTTTAAEEPANATS